MQYLRWTPVAERKPDAELKEYRERYGEDACREFIVYIGGALYSTMLAYDGRGFFIEEGSEWDDGDRDYYEVTHWMPMPPIPVDCIASIDLMDDFKPEYELLEVILT